jgi:thioredoxin-related protein
MPTMFRFRSGASFVLLALAASVVAAPRVTAQELVKPTAPASVAAPTPADARVLLKDAAKKATKEKKAVLVVFGASWCGWCHRLDAFLVHPDAKPILEENYVIVHLDVKESGPKKAQENPSGNEVLAELGGAEAGLPFYAFLNAKGDKIADSNAMPKNSNIGYPAAPEEITAFEGLLKKTAPRLKDDKRAKLIGWLKANAPKQ